MTSTKAQELKELNQFAHTSGDVKQQYVSDATTERHNEYSDQFRMLFAEIDKQVFEKELYLDATLSRNTLARDLSTNIRYITLAIKQETGCSFTQYNNNYRVARAITLMREKNANHSVQQIALQCGYTTVSSFYRNFKSVTGQTPAAYLERLAQE